MDRREAKGRKKRRELQREARRSEERRGEDQDLIRVSAVSSIWRRREKKKAKGREGLRRPRSVQTFLLMRRGRKCAHFLGALHTLDTPRSALLPEREIRNVGRDDERTTSTLAAGRDAPLGPLKLSSVRKFRFFATPRWHRKLSDWSNLRNFAYAFPPNIFWIYMEVCYSFLRLNLGNLGRLSIF